MNIDVSNISINLNQAGKTLGVVSYSEKSSKFDLSFSKHICQTLSEEELFQLCERVLQTISILKTGKSDMFGVFLEETKQKYLVKLTVSYKSKVVGSISKVKGRLSFEQGTAEYIKVFCCKKLIGNGITAFHFRGIQYK